MAKDKKNNSKNAFLLKPETFKKHGVWLVIIIILLSVGIFILN